jgi:hypothetical protein
MRSIETLRCSGAVLLGRTLIFEGENNACARALEKKENGYWIMAFHFSFVFFIECHWHKILHSINFGDNINLAKKILNLAKKIFNLAQR